MSVFCYYHSHCMDGRASAAVVARRHNNASFRAVNYGDVPQQGHNGDTVYIVDFSFPAEIMRKLKEAAHKVIWIDHHKTALPLAEELGWGEVNLDECGATLTWEVLFGPSSTTPATGPMPEILKYVRDRDLWKWELGFSREISEALASIFTGGLFNGLLETDPRDLVAKGKVLRDERMADISRSLVRAYKATFHDLPIMAINTYENQSETGEMLLEKYPGVKAALMYWRTNDRWIYSLRSRPGSDVDVSTLAKTHGGGGHFNASGFQGDFSPGEIEELVTPKRQPKEMPE